MTTGNVQVSTCMGAGWPDWGHHFSPSQDEQGSKCHLFQSSSSRLFQHISPLQILIAWVTVSVLCACTTQTDILLQAFVKWILDLNYLFRSQYRQCLNWSVRVIFLFLLNFLPCRLDIQYVLWLKQNRIYSRLCFHSPSHQL